MKFKEKVKVKAVELKAKAKETLERFGAYWSEHDELDKVVLYGITGIIGGIITGVATISGGGPAPASCLVEDDVTGLDFRTKKPLTNSQILELGDRMIDGQTKGEALSEMGMLKKERKRR